MVCGVAATAQDPCRTAAQGAGVLDERPRGTEDGAASPEQLLAFDRHDQRRRMRSKSFTPSSSSRSRIWRDNAGCAVRMQ
jgi:hypothetical protein